MNLEPNNLCKLAIHNSNILCIGEKLRSIHCHANGGATEMYVELLVL